MALSSVPIEKQLETLIQSQDVLVRQVRSLIDTMQKDSSGKPGRTFQNVKNISGVEATSKVFEDLAREITKGQEEASQKSEEYQKQQEATQKELIDELKNISKVSKEQFQLKRKSIRDDFEKRKLQFDIDDRQRKVDLTRADEDRKLEIDFYNLGFKKDRNKKSFLQRLFEARREKSGKGIGGLIWSLTKATTGTVYQKTLQDSVGSLKTLANTFAGRVGTGTYEMEQERLSDKKSKMQEQRMREDSAMNLFDPKTIRFREMQQEEQDRTSERTRELLHFKSAFRDFFGSRRGAGASDEATSSEDEAQLEADEQYKENNLKLSASSTNYLEEILKILKEVSDPTKINSAFTVRTAGDGSVRSVAKTAEKSSGGGLLSTLGSLLGLTSGGGLGSALLSKIPGANFLSKGLGIGSKALGGLGRFAKFGLKAASKVALPLTAALGAYDAYQGWGEAGNVFGKKQSQTTFGEKASSAAGGALSGLTFGLLGQDTAAKGIHSAGSKALELNEKYNPILMSARYLSKTKQIQTASKFFQKEGLMGGAKKIGSTLWDEGKGLYNKASDAAPGVLNTAKKFWGSGALGDRLSEAGGFLKEKAGGAWETAKDAGSWVKDKAGSAVSAVGSALGITDLLQQLIELIKKLWGGYEEMIKTGQQKMISFKNNVAALLPTGTQDNEKSASSGKFNPAMNTNNS